MGEQLMGEQFMGQQFCWPIFSTWGTLGSLSVGAGRLPAGRLADLTSKPLDPVLNRTANFLSTRRGKQHCCTDAYPEPGRKTQGIPQTMILRLNHLLAPINQPRNMIGNLICCPIDVLGRLINEINRSLEE
jgi:hypothetical protein